MECTIENKKLIPLQKVISASIVDTYSDVGRMEQRMYHWGARGLRELYSHALPKVKHKVWLPVNSNTHTATLPLDFHEETFVGFVDSRWHKVPLRLNNKITDSRNIVDVECEDTCPKCQQDTGICNDLVITEETNLIVINDTTYEQTIIKKLYPNGDYYLETTTPLFDIETDDVIYTTKKEFIANFDLKPCGCLENTQLNTDNLIKYCPDIYCNYYAPCDTQCNASFGYKIFEESGLIQMDYSYPYDKVYIEYNGFIVKIKGQYFVPSVAFECLVEWVKLRAIKDKKNVARWQILDQKDDYRIAKGNMMKVIGRASLTRIAQAAIMLPKFDIDYNSDYNSYQNCFSSTAAVATIYDTCSSSGTSSIVNTTTIINRTSFVLAVKTGDGAGHPVNDTSAYQNNVLKGATDIEYLFLAGQTLRKIDDQFDFNSTTGTIDISPNKFFTPDSLIIPYNKNL